ncbi:16S rRNA (adenine1518-N6/adenine1519-N6)-dimethyltransferase [Actinopolyspora mzabensis]|uniref:Ribosomal RNA small subunit methyltransferase A n=1 Tax=Actinopolyspora mzabensis TaxID=995066 RepID=A0A1G8VLT8_ACTMZ|nr:16S rRNA (adenine(1518)-N(6)/adenine(1519)-N(6))-dimethyltransferase RsmA [Actinopolyspora mzabensis]SDJ67018.1 16S rRNA (adenine1518-N6/adenine1519-N6)-dimethyltransferase [Actinopolyspora mzabensis]
MEQQPSAVRLLGPAEVRGLAERLEFRPTKKLGQNFVHDPNTVRRIVATAGIDSDDVVLEVGPGIGSLTLGLLGAAGAVTAVEIDSALADRLSATVTDHAPTLAERLRVINGDALRLSAAEFGGPERAPTALVANLPYNVAVPVVLRLLAELPSLRHGLVMVQAEVADRMAAEPGSRRYGAPSAKCAWYADVRRAGSVSRNVFWPVPNVDSGLVAFTRHEPPAEIDRDRVFAVVEAAFAQRRKTLRSALSGWAGSSERAERLLRAAGIDPAARGEQLHITEFAALAGIAETET